MFNKQKDCSLGASQIKVPNLWLWLGRGCDDPSGDEHVDADVHGTVLPLPERLHLLPVREHHLDHGACYGGRHLAL